MRIRRPPQPPPQTVSYQPPTYRGATGLGARQAELRQRMQAAQRGYAGRGGGGRKKTGIDASELLTDFEQAMDEAHDRLLGRERRQRDRGGEDGARDEAEQTSDEEGLGSPAAKDDGERDLRRIAQARLRALRHRV